jgi:hypothetical protein
MLKYLPLSLSIILVSIIGAQILMLTKSNPYTSDFRSFYSVTQILLHSPQDLYQINVQIHQQQVNLPAELQSLAIQKPLPFAYLPIFLIPYIPLTFFTYLNAYWIAIYINTIILIIAIYLLIKTFKPKNQIIISIISLSFTPLYSVLHLTQSSFLSLILFTLIYRKLQIQKYFSAGLLAGLLIYKPQLTIILIPYLIFHKKIDIIKGFITSSGILILISIILARGNLLEILYFWSGFLGISEINNISWPQRISLSGLWSQIQLIIPTLPTLELTLITTAIVYIYTLIILRNIIYNKSITHHNTKPLALSFCIIILGTLLTGIHIHSHDVIILLFPFFYFISQKNTLKPNFKIIISISITWIIFFLFSYSPFYPEPFIILPSLTLLYLWFLTIKKQSINL